MAGKRLEYDIVTDPSQGIAGLKQFSAAAKRELKSTADALEDTRTNAQKVADTLSEMAATAKTELQQAATAADALSTALGPELTGRADVGSIVADLNRMGLTFEEITADADRLAASVKDLDGVRVDAVNKNLGDVDTSLGKMRDNADQSRSVLANMVGNATQDLGALGGIAGTAGVAIGQLGEYAAEGNISLANLAKIAGPMAGLALGVQVLTNYTKDNAEAAAESARQQEAWTNAVEDGGDAAAAYTAELRKSGKILLDTSKISNDLSFELRQQSHDWTGLKGAWRAVFGGPSPLKDLAPLFEKAGITAGQFTQAIQTGTTGAENWAEAIAASTLSGSEQDQMLQLLTQHQDNYAASQANSARNEKIFADTKSDTTREFERSENAIEIERRAHLRNNAAMYEATLRHAELRTAEERTASEAAHVARELDAIKAGLDMEAAVNDFQVDFLTAIAKVNEGTALSGDEILGLKNDILNVAEYAHLNPIEVKALLDAIDAGAIAGVMTLAQNEINKYKLEAEVALVLAKGQSIPGARPGFRVADRGGLIGPGGAVAAERRPEFARLPGGPDVLLTGPSFVPPGTQVTSGAETERILRQAVPVLVQNPAGGGRTTVNVNLPRGIRHADTVKAIERWAKRNGGRRARR